jgi:hypothetical protein
MGTWGSGNLHSDGALDNVATRSDALVKEIWAALCDLSSAEADECEHDALFVAIEWVFALEAAGCFSGWNLPSAADLDAATAPWLARWSDYFDGLSGPEFKAERRAVIAESFARLRDLCARYEAQRSR